MNLLIAVAILICLGIAVCVVVLARKLASPSALPVTAEWIGDLSTARYLPMFRLLTREDELFLRRQPGFKPEMISKLRRQRCQIFRGYVSLLEQDFQRICTAIKLLMLQSRHDRPDLAAVLVRSQVTFAAVMALIQFRLILYRCGMGNVDIGDLVKLFESMRLELRSLVPATSAAGV